MRQSVLTSFEHIKYLFVDFFTCSMYKTMSIFSQLAGWYYIQARAYRRKCVMYYAFLLSYMTSCSLIFKDRDVKLSKTLSYILRHGAEKMGLRCEIGDFV